MPPNSVVGIWLSQARINREMLRPVLDGDFNITPGCAEYQVRVRSADQGYIDVFSRKGLDDQLGKIPRLFGLHQFSPPRCIYLTRACVQGGWVWNVVHSCWVEGRGSSGLILGNRLKSLNLPLAWLSIPLPLKGGPHHWFLPNTPLAMNQLFTVSWRADQGTDQAKTAFVHPPPQG